MIITLVLLVIFSLVVPIVVTILKKFLKVAVKWQPLLPLGVGIIIGIILYFIPSMKFTLRESVLFGLASGGIGTIAYDFLMGLKAKAGG